MEVETANCKCRVSQCQGMEMLSVERPLKVDIEINGLDVLVRELYSVFSKEHVNIQDVQKLMTAYDSQPKDWRRYAKYDRYRYTRNLVDAGKGSFDVMVLCWGPGHASAVHDHADSHCFMKVLSGRLEEVRYRWPDDVEPEVVRKLSGKSTRCAASGGTTVDGVCRDGGCPSCGGRSGRPERGQRDGDQNGGNEMVETGRTTLERNDVCYINDALGLHRMENPSHVDGAVSLHLYCPPFDSCRAFDARTGKPTVTKVTFWSMYGKKIKRVIGAGDVTDSQE